jgi:amino acid adenylation domain-containing protein
MSRLQEGFERSAREGPTQVALEDPAAGATLTYRELDRAAEGVREALERGGVGPGDRVAVWAPKSAASVVGLLGALKSGAAYVPLDASAPYARNAQILADCGVKAVLAHEDAAEHLQAAPPADCSFREASGTRPRGELLPLFMKGPASSTAGGAHDHDLAYILYTSGSTGRPKGVMHSHESGRSFVRWCQDVLRPTRDDRFSSHAPFHFDLSILDLFASFECGARVVLFGEEMSRRPAEMAALIASRDISIWYSTPATLRLLVEYGELGRHDFPALRIVCFAGEVFPVKNFRTLRAAWPRPRYLNLYGPTETNVCTWYEVPAGIPDERSDPFPIGRACAHCRTVVVDEEGTAVAAGQEGELCVSGPSVMAGYWNLPQQTAAAFLATVPGERWYKTGDVVRPLANGDHVFLGRRDRMVKRRGYRIELGEIEAALYRHPEVREVAVAATGGAGEDVRITAWMCLRDDIKSSTLAMKQFCARALPAYMIPDAFQFRDRLPKTSTDKMDYQALLGS